MKLLAIFVVAALFFAGCLNAQPKEDVQGANGVPSNQAAENRSVQELGPEETAPLPEGVRAVYLDYNPDEFAKSLSERKVIFLEFVEPESGEWIAFEPQIYEAFSQMGGSRKYANVIGFRVVMGEWEELAGQYGASGNNTHVVIGRDGTVLIKETEMWDAQKLIGIIGQAS